MKNATRGFLCCLLLAAIAGCEKDHYYYVRGKAVHAYTEAPVEGLCIGLFYECGINCGSSSFGWGTSDSLGDFKIKMDLGSYGNVLYNIPLIPFDTTANMFKYMNDVKTIIQSGIEPSINVMKLEPSGCILMQVSDSVWNSINADTIIVQTPYVTRPIIRNVTDYDSRTFYVEPSQTSTFQWYYIKNGVSGPMQVRNIFVPNYYRSFNGYYLACSTVKYQITF